MEDVSTKTIYLLGTSIVQVFSPPILPKMLYVGILIYSKVLSILINIKLLKFNFNGYSHERKFIFIYI